MNAWTEPPIPGETPIDNSGLKIKGITTRQQLNAVEAEAIRKVTLKYLASKPSARIAPFRYGWFLSLHGEMFADIWEWAGTIRSVELNLGCSVASIAESLATLHDDLHSWSGYSMPRIEQAARLHHQAVRIHPFNNGNGRWARMLANIWLRRHDQQVVVWPEEVIGAESTIRQQYLQAIRQADAGELDPLILIHQSYQRAF